MTRKDDSEYIEMAITQAKKGNTPFGAVLVNTNGEFVEAYNTAKNDGPTAHAEINAIRKIDQLKFEKAQDLTLYSTVEPCPMCMTAIIWAGIGTVVYGATIEDAAEFGNQIDIKAKDIAKKSWYQLEVKEGVSRNKCTKLFTHEN
ncbi:nucleoside deaminase [Fulvivirga sp. RKSG066]|uniref:nucleoside deaminase n=1 Tax=Fulvivirga aurantia TaxID=2529383 RepID=UPI0012BB4C54|nr:nucleoside deaminase [Fulvivirga aurantia]MTI22548.1 nucleoside deaminase [Fulvivirga aurantia]